MLENLNTFKEEGCFASTFEQKYYHYSNALIKRSLWPREFRTGYYRLHVLYMTNIPVLTVYCDFEDDGAYYLVMKYINSMSMSELQEEEKSIVSKEVNQHLITLQNLKSRNIGRLTRIIIPLYQNIIIDPGILKIKAIIDWEYSGFYPSFFKALFYKRLGPLSAI
ncbi:hypothetical protein B0J14DRAFT_667466 [Halenospora varia]|nr:hypothetical protein B0J14DRAFT_667466 [Halenospora varia]